MMKYRLTFLILVSVVAAALFLAAGEARAASTILADGPSCTTLGGTWDSGTLTCKLTGTLTLGPSDSLDIVSGITLINVGTITSSGDITNDGTIKNFDSGTITTSGSLTNTGMISNSGTVTNDPTGTIDNSGTILNTITGIITSSGNVDNSGTIENCGLITLSGFAVVNSGTINNYATGTLTDSIGITNTHTVTNQGVFTESGTVTNSGGEFMNFAGTFTNTGTFNTGVFFDCGGIVTGIAPGIVSENCQVPAPNTHCSIFVIPESPIGLVALMGSSLAALGVFMFWKKRSSSNSANGPMTGLGM